MYVLVEIQSLNLSKLETYSSYLALYKRSCEDENRFTELWIKLSSKNESNVFPTDGM
jgi:hypothetical protein